MNQRVRRRFARWAEENGVRVEQAGYPRPQAGGRVDALRLRPARAPRGRVLAVHGTGNDALFPLAGLFKALLGRGLEVFAFDLDGHGRGSDTVFRSGAIGGAVPAALGAAADAPAALPLHAVGESLGAALLLRALANRPPLPLRSAVLVGLPLGLRVTPGVVAREVAGLLSRPGLAAGAHFGAWGSLPAFGPFRRRAHPVRLAGGAAGPFAYLDEARRALAGLALAKVSELSAPTLFLTGARDRVVERESVHRLALKTGAEQRLISGATHCVTPVHPSTVAATVEWILEHNPA